MFIHYLTQFRLLGDDGQSRRFDDRRAATVWNIVNQMQPLVMPQQGRPLSEVDATNGAAQAFADVQLDVFLVRAPLREHLAAVVARNAHLLVRVRHRVLVELAQIGKPCLAQFAGERRLAALVRNVEVQVK